MTEDDIEQIKLELSGLYDGVQERKKEFTELSRKVGSLQRENVKIEAKMDELREQHDAAVKRHRTLQREAARYIDSMTKAPDTDRFAALIEAVFKNIMQKQGIQKQLDKDAVKECAKSLLDNANIQFGADRITIALPKMVVMMD